MSDQWWSTVTGPKILQGDWLRDCAIPMVDYFEAPPEGSPQAEPLEIDAVFGVEDVIVVSQSCDIESGRARLIAVCPIYTLPQYEAVDDNFKKSGRWDEVRKGRIEGLHLLASPDKPDDNRSCLVVSFRQIYSLPAPYLAKRAEAQGSHARRESPYLEHFSQTFARFFMRVGLPSGIEPFK